MILKKYGKTKDKEKKQEKEVKNEEAVIRNSLKDMSTGPGG